MVAPLHRQTVVFIVRVWAEYLDDQPPSWRGVVEGCEPGEIHPFISVEEMTQIIQQQSISGNQNPDIDMKKGQPPKM